MSLTFSLVVVFCMFLCLLCFLAHLEVSSSPKISIEPEGAHENPIHHWKDDINVYGV